MFIHHEGKSYGLSESDHRFLDGLVDFVMKVDWVCTSLSREFVEKAFCDWARQRFAEDEQPFARALSTAARESVKAVEVWAPIANMEVEQSFDFGPVRIESITAAVIENLRSRGSSTRPEHEQQISQFFEELKHEIQGYAAVVVSMEAEPVIAQKRALRLAQDAIGLLSFFSPAAPRSYLEGVRSFV